MGAAASVKGVREGKEGDIVGKDAYAWWTLDTVKKAYERALSMNVNPRAITRRQYVDVFTDMHVLKQLPGKPAAFLSLPLSLFNVFAEPDATGNLVANMMELFAILTLFCKGETTPQLTFMFSIFDADKSNTITPDEMEELLFVLGSAAFKIGLLSPRPTAPQIAHITQLMFAKVDVTDSGFLTCKQFIEWASDFMLSKKLVQSFEKARSYAATAARSTGGTIHSMADMVDEARNAAKAAIAKERSAAQRAAQLNSLLLASTALKKIIADASVQFDTESVRLIRRRFKELASANKEHPDQLTGTQFKQILREEFPILASVKHAIILDQLFEAFDADKSNTIDFKEMAMGLSRYLTGSLSSKIQLVFEACDTDGDQCISLQEMLSMIQDTAQDVQDVTTFTQQIMQSLDENGDGTVSRVEFEQALQAHPVLFDCITNATANEKLNVFRQVFAGRPEFSIEGIESAWDTCVELNIPSSIDMSTYRQVMVDIFLCTHEMMSAIGRLFDVLDSDNDDLINLRDVFNGLAQIVGTTLDQRTSLYFKMYGKADGTDMDLSEVMKMVMDNKAATASSVTELEKLLGRIDANGDGVLTFHEFESACQQQPELLAAFAKLLGAANVEGSSEAVVSQAHCRRIGRLLTEAHRVGVVSQVATKKLAPSAKQGLVELRRLSVSSAADLFAMLHTQISKEQDDLIKGKKLAEKRQLHIQRCNNFVLQQTATTVSSMVKTQLHGDVRGLAKLVDNNRHEEVKERKAKARERAVPAPRKRPTTQESAVGAPAGGDVAAVPGAPHPHHSMAQLASHDEHHHMFTAAASRKDIKPQRRRGRRRHDPADAADGLHQSVSLPELADVKARKVRVHVPVQDQWGDVLLNRIHPTHSSPSPSSPTPEQQAETWDHLTHVWLGQTNLFDNLASPGSSVGSPSVFAPAVASGAAKVDGSPVPRRQTALAGPRNIPMSPIVKTRSSSPLPHIRAQTAMDPNRPKFVAPRPSLLSELVPTAMPVGPPME